MFKKSTYVLARQQLEMNNRGTALCWALKARDAEICSKIAEYELECFHSTETWSIPALVDAMENNSNNIYSEKLLFLSKYKQVGKNLHFSFQHLFSFIRVFKDENFMKQRKI